MSILIKNDIIWVSIPKCASMSIEDALLNSKLDIERHSYAIKSEPLHTHIGIRKLKEEFGDSSPYIIALTANSSIENKDEIDLVDARPNFIALIYPVISMDSSIYHGGSLKNLLGESPSKELIRQYSNELNVTEDTPPTFIIHSNDDKGVKVENSLRFHKSLNQNGIKNEMHIYPYGGHGYSLATGMGQLSKWPDLLIDWIKSIN